MPVPDCFMKQRSFLGPQQLAQAQQIALERNFLVTIDTANLLALQKCLKDVDVAELGNRPFPIDDPRNPLSP